MLPKRKRENLDLDTKDTAEMNHESKSVEVWDTPVTGLSELNFGGLSDDGKKVAITVRNSQVTVRFEWDDYCAYKVTLEEQHIPFDPLDARADHSLNSATVTSSKWISELRNGNELLDILQPGLKHFVISTSEYWIEILSKKSPTIIQN